MSQLSSAVLSNQISAHKELESISKKHLSNVYKKPYRQFSEEIFNQIDQLIKVINLPIILDSGCGTGASSLKLLELYPDNLVIGIDKSEKRLAKFLDDKSVYQKNNLIIARADVIDIWRLAKLTKWNIKKHYLLYPNPWPKKDQFKRRWHAHPIFPQMVSLCDQIELRTNWEIYAEEFKQVLEMLTGKNVLLETIGVDSFISPFEKKYHESGHELYRVILK